MRVSSLCFSLLRISLRDVEFLSNSRGFGRSSVDIMKLNRSVLGIYRTVSMIRAENLVKTFGDFTAVKGISFDVQQGEIFAFLGPNGAGKTTTIKMLTTLLRPTSGTIELDGLNPAVKQHEARRRFGIVFQDPSLDNEQTAYENMELHGILYRVPRKVRTERIETLLRIFELWDRRDNYVKEFSGGMK